MSKTKFGSICEDFVGELLSVKTGLDVSNLNEIKMNHPTTDLVMTDSNTGDEYEVSVKAKKGKVWPAVKGINKENQYIVFVDLYMVESPIFYVLNNAQWRIVLETIQPHRDSGAEIINGALEWNWVKDGKNKKFRGSQLNAKDISDYINNWAILPGVENA
ncbi:hypothetical protein [Pseudoalteromonas sp. Z1A8]|uniref:hypothetical protein n=1 Tax=Pseudoalteromonas sp. Z1A8 TaxID=2686354 RepID=UPI00140B4316|nr:hypothetical protein [Pseudoalteromonas sp. Z1A8]